MADRVIPEGARFLKPANAGKKFDRGRSWVWAKIKNDPDFPQPVYLDPNVPLLIEQELDAWAASRARGA